MKADNRLVAKLLLVSVRTNLRTTPTTARGIFLYCV